MERKLIGVKALAQYLDISVNTVYSWVHQGRMPYYKVGRLVKFEIQEIDKWLKGKKIKEFSWQEIDAGKKKLKVIWEHDKSMPREERERRIEQVFEILIKTLA